MGGDTLAERDRRRGGGGTRGALWEEENERTLVTEGKQGGKGGLTRKNDKKERKHVYTKIKWIKPGKEVERDLSRQ